VRDDLFECYCHLGFAVVVVSKQSPFTFYVALYMVNSIYSMDWSWTMF